MTLYFCYIQPERVWIKNGCAENKWIAVNIQDKTIERWTNYYCGTEDLNVIKVSMKDLNKIYNHFVNIEGFTEKKSTLE